MENLKKVVIPAEIQTKLDQAREDTLREISEETKKLELEATACNKTESKETEDGQDK